MNIQKQRFNYPNGPLPDGFILKYFSFRALQVGNRNGSAVYPAKLTSILVAKVTQGHFNLTAHFLIMSYILLITLYSTLKHNLQCLKWALRGYDS